MLNLHVVIHCNVNCIFQNRNLLQQRQNFQNEIVIKLMSFDIKFYSDLSLIKLQKEFKTLLFHDQLHSLYTQLCRLPTITTEQTLSTCMRWTKNEWANTRENQWLQNMPNPIAVFYKLVGNMWTLVWWIMVSRKRVFGWVNCVLHACRMLLLLNTR